MKNSIKQIAKNLNQVQRIELITEFLNLNNGQITNMKNYLNSIECVNWFYNAKSGFDACAVLCMVAIKNK